MNEYIEAKLIIQSKNNLPYPMGVRGIVKKEKGKYYFKPHELNQWLRVEKTSWKELDNGKQA